jgi:hypothetical protein
MPKPSIVKESRKIQKLLIERISGELGLTNKAVSVDAEEHDQKISVEALSRYFKHPNPKGGLSESNILWLCYRYGVFVTLNVTKVPYNERKNFQLLKKLFPKK